MGLSTLANATFRRIRNCESVNGETVWNQEYESLQVIPSSVRVNPSRALLLFSELLQFESQQTVLDAGCGNGRNAAYLAKKGCTVHAVDFSKVALRMTHQLVQQERLQEKVFLSRCSLKGSFPLSSNSFQLALDSYVSCHFLSETERTLYATEMRRVLKPGGVLFSSVMSVDDDYYGPLLGDDPENRIVVDPKNYIKKQLFTDEEVKNLFSSNLDLVYFVKLEFEDIVLGKPYWRGVFASIWRK